MRERKNLPIVKRLLAIILVGLILLTALPMQTLLCAVSYAQNSDSTEEDPPIDDIPVTEILLTPTEITLEPGETVALDITVFPDTATDKTLTFESSSPLVASVDSDGAITALREGCADITVTAVSGVSAVCSVTVSYKYFTVRFLDIDGSVISEQSVREGFPAQAPAIPVHTGYDFTGWLPADFDCITQDVDVQSTWSMTVYDITLVLNGGTCDEFPTSYTVESGSISLPSPTRNGYTFRGWYDNSDFSGDAIESIETGSSGNKVFYAAWDVVSYNITYELGGGSIHTVYFSSYNIESPDVYFPIPERMGYDFCGWYDNPSFSGEPMVCIASGSFGNVRVYASWTAKIYTIQYELAGGAFSHGSVTTYTIESDYITLPTPERTGYDFLGWYDNAAFGGVQVQGISAGSYGNRVYYAKWSPTRYSITVRTYGGTIEGTVPASYTIESETIFLPAAGKTGYTFIGWYDNEEFAGNPVTEIESGSYGDKYFFARFDIITYLITYNLNGGTFDVTAPAGYDVESETIILPVPTRTAYVFDGWYANQTYMGDSVVSIEHGSVGDVSLYAKWTPIRYTVTYNTNGGELSQFAITAYTIESLDFMLPQVTKRGYDFAGWYDNQAFSGNAVLSIPQGSYGDKAFYAKWQPTVYFISYSVNGGVLPAYVPTEYNIESQSFSLPVPVRPGYDFSGWYDNTELSGNAVYSVPSGSTGNMELYAAWTPVIYRVTYNMNGGTVEGSLVFTYTIESDTIILPQAEKRGYTFRGWYSNPEYSGLSVTAIAAGSYGDITLYARFDVIIYHITYYTNGGSVTNAPTEFTVESGLIILPSPSRVGYSFAGWYRNDEFTGERVNAVLNGSVGDVILYAKWNIVFYTITYNLQGGVMPQGEIADTFTIESDAIELPVPTRVGYVHTGWYETAECNTTPLRTIERGSYGDKTLYSGWRRLKFYVRFFDRDGITLLSDAYVEYGYAATPPTTVPAHEGYYFAGWSGDYSFISADTDFIAVYELVEYTVTFTDIDYSVIERQNVKYGQSAKAPVPPEHDDCVFVFWSCDFSCVKSDLTVTAVYRAVTVNQKPVSGQRFITNEYVASGDDYIAAVEANGMFYALTSLTRYGDYGLWAMPLYRVGNTLKPADDTAYITDAVFSAEGSDRDGYVFTAESGGRLTMQSGDFTILDTSTDDADRFIYQYRNGAWRLYDYTKSTYLCLNSAECYFTTGSILQAASITLFKRINLPDYVERDEPVLNKLYTLVAVRHDGTAFALTERDGELFGTPAEVADGKLYFFDNIDERPVAFRMVFGDNKKGFSLRSASSGKYLGIEEEYLSLTDEMQNYWVCKTHPLSNDKSLCEINTGKWVYCNADGVFFAEDETSHTRLYLFERSRSTGVMGDLNMDGKVNTGDAVMILKASAGIVNLTKDQLANSDTNADSRLNTGDAVYILRYVVGICDWLG